MKKRGLILVRDQIVSSSRLAVIGEIPGKDEAQIGMCFVGNAGALLNRFLHLAGFPRREVSILNVCRRFAPDIAEIPAVELEFWREDLRRRLAALPNVRVVVPMGNTALEAVLGADRIRLSRQKKLTITKAQNFYFDNIKLDDGRVVLVMPVQHPAATFHNPKITPICEDFWRRLGREMRQGIGSDDNKLGPLLEDRFKHDTAPHPDDALDFAHQLIREGKPVSVDIETPKEAPRDKIYIAGFSNDGLNSMIIPCADFRGLKGAGPNGAAKFREAIRLICESSLEKIGANLLFDAFELRKLYKIRLRRVKWDVRMMHLVLDPRRDHDLSSMTGWMFRTRYWKAKDEEAREADDYTEFCKYNGIDVCSTWHVAMTLRARLERTETFRAYWNIYRRRFYPLLRIMLHGTLIHQVERDERFQELETECARIRTELETIAGVSLAGEKSLSTQKVMRFLYGPKDPPPRQVKMTKTGKVAKNQPPPFPKGLGLKPIIHKDKDIPTSNEVALRKLRLRVEGKNQRAMRSLNLILDHRRQATLASFLREDRVDEDNRFRCSFGFAETGRLTSSENPYGTGANAQNIARKARSAFLPDKDCIFLGPDLSAAEDRLCKVYSKDPQLIALARTKPWDYDAHLHNASEIFGIALDELTKRYRAKEEEAKMMRDLGKRIVHGSQRGLGGQTMSDNLLKDGYVYTRGWCDEKIEKYHLAFPGIKGGYFAYVRERVMSEERLVNPWGFAMTFYGERKDDALMRDAYSFLLQSCCVFVLDLQGLIPLDWMIQRGAFPGARINNEVHDAVYVSAPIDCAFDVAEFLAKNLEHPVDYDGVSLSIPSTLKIGASLADEDSIEFKQFPDRDSFNKEAERLLELANKKRKDAEGWTAIRRERQKEAKRLAIIKQQTEEAEKRRIEAEKKAVKEAKEEAKKKEREARLMERARIRAEKAAAKAAAKAAKKTARQRRTPHRSSTSSPSAHPS